MLDGAEDGPGEKTGIDSDCWCFEMPADSVLSRSAGLIAKGPRHSLMAELGVRGDSPRFAERRPPRMRLVLNSCSCMMRFMLGPIHLLLFFTASYASCTLNAGFLYSPYATTKLADLLTPHWQCTRTRCPSIAFSSMSLTSRKRSGTMSLLCSHLM